MSSAATIPSAEPPRQVALDDIQAATNKYIPVDRTVEFTPELFPRDPDAYEPSDHFYQKQKDPERLLTRPIGGFSAIRKTIYAGVLRNNTRDGCAEFLYDHYGVEYLIVVGYHKEGYPLAVTGWPKVIDQEWALNSGMWTDEEIETIVRINESYLQHKTTATTSKGRPYDQYFDQ